MKQIGEFRRRYFEAKRRCIGMTAPMIIETLPEIHMCSIMLDETITELCGDELQQRTQQFFQQYKGTCVHPEDRMVNWIGRDFSPLSIEISVIGVTPLITTFKLLIVGPFRGSRLHFLSRNDQICSPWVPKPPITPPGWRNVLESGRFSIKWRRNNGPDAT